VLLLAGAALTLPLGCRKSPPPPTPAWVAMVETTPIEPAQLRQAWERRQRGVATNLSASVVLADLVDEVAAYEQARRGGFLERPEIQAAVRQLIVSRYRESQQTNNPVPTEPSDRELRELYAARTNSFVRPLALNVAVVFHEVPKSASAEKRLEARQTVASWRTGILAAADPAKAFGAMTAQRSADSATRYRRGELGWLGLDELGQRLTPEASAVAAKLEIGTLSEPIETVRGFYLLRLVGRRPAEVRPFAEVEPALRYRMREDRRAAAEARFRADARHGLTIRTNLLVLENLARTNRPAAAPPRAMPKG
jgi:hypothetical protein